ncbi:hypothetical protein C8R44DRAFT_884701 [Mycena epipterygia]|nr:hypothetical protein C8R44DRAFT_884701 [Mycena epipterygia]
MSTLPPELEIQIFESLISASPYDAALRLSLMSVARRVQIWVEPFVYHCLVFSRVNNWSRLKRIAESKEPQFLARHVKSICMPLYTVSMQEASEILSVCTGVERLACWIDHRAMATTPAIPQSIPLRALALRRLSIELSHFLSLTADSKACLTLTHLELVHWELHADHYPPAVSLAGFPSLTHVALRSDALRFQWPLVMVLSMVRTCRQLKILLLLDYIAIGESETIRRGLNDSRAVVILSEVALHDWEPRAKLFHEWDVRMGGMDMWARGEGIIRRNSP